MSLDVLREWLPPALEAEGAVKVELRRAKATVAISSWVIASTTPEAIMGAATADLGERRMARGTFVVAVVDASRTVLQKHRIDVNADDDASDDASDGDGSPWRSVALASAKSIASLTRANVELVQATTGIFAELRMVVHELADGNARQQGHVAEAMATMFELSTAKEAVAKEERASSERRELGSKFISEFGPIAGAVATHWKGSTHPAMIALLRGLKPDQQDAIFALLSDEQKIAFGAMLEALDPKAKQAPSPAAPAARPENGGSTPSQETKAEDKP